MMPYKLFFLSVLFSSVFTYISNAIISAGIMVISGLAVVVQAVFRQGYLSARTLTVATVNGAATQQKSTLLFALSWVPFCVYALLIYFSHPAQGRYFSGYSLTLSMIPLIGFVLHALFTTPDISLRKQHYLFVHRALATFLLVQLLICLGQLSTYSFGLGLPVSHLYADWFAITGTLTNANDLGALVLAISFFVIGLEKFFFKESRPLFWVVAFVLLLLTASRSAIFMTVLLFFLSRLNNIRQLIGYVVTVVIVGVVVTLLLNYVDLPELSHMTRRLNSFINIADNGVMADASMNARSSSYVYFLKQLPVLGFGSWEINNYYQFAGTADFIDKELLFRHPHALIVEIGYWLGWLGLFLFMIPVGLIWCYSRRKILVILTVLMVSVIPSGVLDNIPFFLLMMVCFFDFHASSNVD